MMESVHRYRTMPGVPAALVAVLRGEPVRWCDLGLTRNEFFDVCDREDLRGLMFCQIAASDASADWPAEVRDELSQWAREETAREMLRREEIVAVLDALAAGGAPAIVLKGTALAYSVYDTPIARPRLDTDLLIDAAHQDAARRALGNRGYTAPRFCDQLFSQFQMEKTDAFGIRHVIDVHWKISTQPIFADVLAYEDVWSRAVSVPALGPAAVAPTAVDALLLACIHPAMHHQNNVRVLWQYDVHLLASSLDQVACVDFARRARERSVAMVCAHELRRTHSALATVMPAGVFEELQPIRVEPSAEYLQSGRRWHDEALGSVRALPRFADRVRLARHVLFPSSQYMLRRYGLADHLLSRACLPVLYLHRNISGLVKVVVGNK